MHTKKTIIGLAVMAAVLLPVSAYALSDKANSNASKADATERVNAAKERAREKLLEAKTKAEERKLTLQADKCEDRKDKLKAAVPNLSKSIESLKTNLDKNYDRITLVAKSGKLTAINYDDLASAVDEAKAEAESSIKLVDPAAVTVDCAATGLGTQLDSYRSTVKVARDSLKQYHKALVDLVSAMNASDGKSTTDQDSASDAPEDNTNTENAADSIGETEDSAQAPVAPPVNADPEEEASNEGN